MRAETDHLVPDLFLKAYHDRHRKNHHRQSQGDPDHGNTNSGRSNLTIPLLAEMYLFGDK